MLINYSLSLYSTNTLFLEDSNSIRVFDDLTTMSNYNVKKTIVSSTDDSSLTDPASLQLCCSQLHRFVDLELSNISFDPSSTAVKKDQSQTLLNLI